MSFGYRKYHAVVTIKSANINQNFFKIIFVNVRLSHRYGFLYTCMVEPRRQMNNDGYLHKWDLAIIKSTLPCTHEMRTMHLIREQVGCTVHVKKGRRKRKNKGPKLLRCSFFIFGHLFNKFCLCWPAHVLFSARIWYIISHLNT